MLNHLLKFFSLLLFIQSLVACSSTPEKATEYILYPPPPDSPRIQYLTSFSGPDDLAEDQSAFNDFILGAEGRSNTTVVKPYGVSIKDGIIYLVDIRRSGFATFDLKQKKFEMVHGSFEGRLVKPINIFIDDENHKYVTDIKRNMVIVFDKDNAFVRTIGDGETFKPSDVVVADERVFISDVKNHVIHVYNKNTAEKLYTIDGRDSDIEREGILYYPTNIALSPDKHLYVSATMNFNIQEYTLEGKFVRNIGQVGKRVGNFSRPKGINLDKNGNIYVVDAAFQNVQIFNQNAELLMYFGKAGGHPLKLPAKVFIDYDNIAYFQKYAKPGFEIEYLILVTSQFGRNKLNIYGFGQMQDDAESSDKPDITEPDAVKPDVTNQ